MTHIYSRSYTTAQIRSAERYWLSSTAGATATLAGADAKAVVAQPSAPGTLMRRAAWALAETVIARMPSPVPGRLAVLLVGAGNNGGDALFAGAILRRRGMAVTAILADPHRAHLAGLAALRRAGGRIVSGDSVSSDPIAALLGRADVILDGLVGLGAVPPLRRSAEALVVAANAAAGWRIAIDLPSGIEPDTGREIGAVFHADITVTFGGMKTGLLFAQSAGDVHVADIGMAPEQCQPSIPYDTSVMTDADVGWLLPQPGPTDNKFSLGVTGIVAGSARYPGAALLAVGGAVSARPGLVRYVGTHAAEVVQRWPEVVAAQDVPAAGRVQAWVVGPGIGIDGAAAALMRDVLAADVPVLVDADGLTVLAQIPSLLADRVRRGMTTVLTPHDGEFARLFPDIDPAGPAGRLGVVRAAANRSGAVVLLKGHRTVIADPGGRAFVNTAGSPYLATAGSGDVLSGLTGALLSAGMGGLEAAALAAHMHGQAGQRAAAAKRAGASALLDFLI
ncbi:MAG: NAD(P)H-hydrate dehydratase [Nakamurella sp.]